MSNHLASQTSPYLLQHSQNPVNWYPWCTEAFEKAKEENKPIFLSIGYSTCHWCHVMAHESFEDETVAKLLNENFVSIKVDKEERPDIDSIYMSVCQALTGSGGWPTSIFMTPDQKPFFAGTYFPKTSRHGTIGFLQLLTAVKEKWTQNQEELFHVSDEIISHLNQKDEEQKEIIESLSQNAMYLFRESFDKNYGGFGKAPKFPTPHNLLFLLDYYETQNDSFALEMAEVTLKQMYRGGIFDHIGYGFSRYSTDRYFLVPHFEKMLYDNALLMLAYTKAYSLTKKPLYLMVAEKTAAYVLREMVHPEGGFYSAQDADSDGTEGKYYVLDYQEALEVLGDETGREFNRYYGITPQGNFEGKNIPNLLANNEEDDRLEGYLPQLYCYRKNRARLHLDDKILSAWNSLMIAALAGLYRASGKRLYLEAAERAQRFLSEKLTQDKTLFVSWREGRKSGKGFLDDYSFYVYALLCLYETTGQEAYLEKSQKYCYEAIQSFWDEKHDGFYLYGKENEQLILKPKETYDGAMPSGNSVMAYNLVKLQYLLNDDRLSDYAEKQMKFMCASAKHYPAGYGFFLLALSLYFKPPTSVVAVLKNENDRKAVLNKVSLRDHLKILEDPTAAYPLIHDKCTFYVCEGHSCLPPSNEL